MNVASALYGLELIYPGVPEKPTWVGGWGHSLPEIFEKYVFLDAFWGTIRSNEVIEIENNKHPQIAPVDNLCPFLNLALII